MVKLKLRAGELAFADPWIRRCYVQSQRRKRDQLLEGCKGVFEQVAISTTNERSMESSFAAIFSRGKGPRNCLPHEGFDLWNTLDIPDLFIPVEVWGDSRTIRRDANEQDILKQMRK